MADKVSYPVVGCIVEYLEGNAAQLAMIIGAVGERLRLLLPNRRESNLPQSRLLPWLGPVYTTKLTRDEMIKLLEEHKTRRNALQQNLNIEEVWELAQGEVEQASCQWLAELVESSPDYDTIAAYGRAMLACKTHFRYQPPVFQIYNAEVAGQRLEDQQKRLERDLLLGEGRSFVQLLWDVAQGRRTLPPQPATAGLGEWPSANVAQKIEELLRLRLLSPDDEGSSALWDDLTKGLPEVPQIPLQLLMAWEKLPPHYNVWLAQSGFDITDNWWQPFANDVLALQEASNNQDLPLCTLPLVSIDSSDTRDIDDAFFVAKDAVGYQVTLALAAPALAWPFGSAFDKAVLNRSTSLYLPEQTTHMLPEPLGIDAYSLWANVERVAFLVDMRISPLGEIVSCTPSFARVKLAANLHYKDCEAVINGQELTAANPAAPFQEMLQLGYKMSQALQAQRIQHKAIVMEREEPHIRLEGTGADTRVILEPLEMTTKAQTLVAELMISASAAIADYGKEHALPMVHRTQDVTVPAECVGVWREPHEIFKVLRVLVPSILETKIAPHAALGLSNYTPCTSPLRRYGDLLNEAQIAAYLKTGSPKFSLEELDAIVKSMNLALSQVQPVQRQRPRYWKLLYFKQQGDKVFWPGVICDDGDSYLTVNLPEQGFSLRARRQLFDDRVAPGSKVRVRIGKVQPIWNDIQIVEAMSEDTTG